MKQIFSAGLIALAIAACNSNTDSGSTEKGDTTAAPISSSSTSTTMNTLTEQQKAEGWQSLFDGQTTKGWHRYGGGPVGSAWKVTDGTLYLDTAAKADWQTKDGGDIATDEEYDNFHLKLEWKIAKDGNSGIMFYVHEGADSVKYKHAWYTGPEMQVLDNSGHPDAKINKHRAGDLYDLIAASKETVKPAGEWNAVVIKSLNGKLDFWLNGENVVSTTLWDDNWKKLVKGSKFAKMPEFGTYKTGRIALQDHGNAVWFRNIQIRKL